MSVHIPERLAATGWWISAETLPQHGYLAGLFPDRVVATAENSSLRITVTGEPDEAFEVLLAAIHKSEEKTQ